MYITYGNYCYRSKNLMDWEDVGYTVTGLSGWGDIWAPEVVYDESTQLYYMFFSATPPNAGNVKYQMLLATSTNPDTGFELVDFTGKHNYDTDTYSQEYAKYLYLDPAKYNAFAEKNGGVGEDIGGYERAIDPHPYVDKDGQKYLLWTDSTTSINRICGVKMKDNSWLTPDWTTAQVLTYGNYYKVEDYKIAQIPMVGSKVETVSSEEGINEGPELIYHNNKYYLTYSVGTFGKNTYQVRQAVADSVLGTYEKLKDDEGGILLKGYRQVDQGATGTGHHSFVKVGEQLFMVYHRHDIPYNEGTGAGGGSSRNIAIDEVKWVKNKNGLDVLYANGPTITLQPAIEAFCDFKNIAGKAQVSGDGVTNPSYLTDGLLSIDGTDKESSISKTTTITFDFNEARSIGGVMVYNSSDKDKCFTKISRIECVCIENGKEIVRTISNVTFDSNYFVKNQAGKVISHVVPGAAAYTTINEWNVKSMRITIEVPEGQNQVGISEIKILGKK